MNVSSDYDRRRCAACTGVASRRHSVHPAPRAAGKWGVGPPQRPHMKLHAGNIRIIFGRRLTS